MSLTTFQYVLIIALVLCTGYFFYLLKQKGQDVDENYYGITFSILDSLQGKEATPENVKKILRIVSESVNYVEDNMDNMINQKKEEIAICMIKEAIEDLNFSYSIDDENIRYLIRLSCAFMVKD